MKKIVMIIGMTLITSMVMNAQNKVSISTENNTESQKGEMKKVQYSTDQTKQRAPQLKTERRKHTYVPLYVISDKELPNYFNSETIPDSFPKYDSELSEKENWMVISQWLEQSGNKELLKNESLIKVENKIDQSQSK